MVKPQPILRALPLLLDAKDAKAREGAKQLTVELCRWVGADLIRSTTMEKMRDAMKKDVEECLARVSGRAETAAAAAAAAYLMHDALTSTDAAYLMHDALTSTDAA